jgi:hypothetical protein
MMTLITLGIWPLPTKYLKMKLAIIPIHLCYKHLMITQTCLHHSLLHFLQLVYYSQVNYYLIFNDNIFIYLLFELFNSFYILYIGDTSSLSNWSYEDNPTLMILMILFAFVMTIYILNVFITLFGEVMTDNDDTFLLMKAKVILFSGVII